MLGGGSGWRLQRGCCSASSEDWSRAGRVGWDRKRRGRSRAGGGREAGRKAPGRAACSPRGGRWQGSGAERRRAGGVPGGPGAPVGERGPGTPGPDRSPGQTGWLPRGLRLLPTCAHRRPVKGRDPGAQVSSSLPGRGGWGPGLPAQVSVPSVTSGHPWPPLRFRSPSRSQGPRGRAPDALHILGAPHLSARIRAPAPAGSPLLAPRPRAGSSGSSGDFSTQSRPFGPSAFCLGSVADSTGGNGPDLGDRLCRPLVLGAQPAPSAARPPPAGAAPGVDFG